MWPFIATYLFSLVSTENIPELLFRQDQIIFASNFTITSIIVPADSKRSIDIDSLDSPNVFFTVADPKSEGGSCTYVLQGLTAYEVLEGGTDTTSDFSSDPSIYLGARNGIYKYYPETLSARRFSPFRDDIKQIQKASGLDVIYILTKHGKMFKIEEQGTKRSKFSTILCATQFVLDTSNNIYYISCVDNLPHIVRSDETIVSLTANIMEDFAEIKLLRPAFLMENCVPFVADGDLYMLYVNGTADKKAFSLKASPSAYSVDAAS